MKLQIYSDKLQGVIRNPFAFYLTYTKGIQWVDTDATDAWTVCTEGDATERNPNPCLSDFAYMVKVCQIATPILV